jgi:hypothetical protein
MSAVFEDDEDFEWPADFEMFADHTLEQACAQSDEDDDGGLCETGEVDGDRVVFGVNLTGASWFHDDDHDDYHDDDHDDDVGDGGHMDYSDYDYNDDHDEPVLDLDISFAARNNTYKRSKVDTPNDTPDPRVRVVGPETVVPLPSTLTIHRSLGVLLEPAAVGRSSILNLADIVAFDSPRDRASQMCVLKRAFVCLVSWIDAFNRREIVTSSQGHQIGVSTTRLRFRLKIQYDQCAANDNTNRE